MQKSPQPDKGSATTRPSVSPSGIGEERKPSVSPSGIECLQSCPRRYYWNYEREFIPAGCDASPALFFGAGIHKALEVRHNGASIKEAITEFRKLFTIEKPPKHTFKGGELIIKEYYREYEDDDYEVSHNEYEFEVPINGFSLRGRFDKVGKLQQYGVIMPLDHKTAGKLGEDFYMQCTPNGQFTSYIYAANELFGNVNTLIVDGILKPYAYKTKPMVVAFDRHLVTRTDYELAQWKRNTEVLLGNLARYREENFFPMHDNGYYCMQCSYRELCLIPMDASEIEPPEEMYKKKEERK